MNPSSSPRPRLAAVPLLVPEGSGTPTTVRARRTRRRRAHAAAARRRRLLLGVLVACALSAAVSAPAHADEESAPVDIAAVDAYVQEQLDDGDLPGAAIAITHDDEVVHVRGYGHDSTGEEITATTPFRIASLSKSFTALAVMQLVDAGSVDLDDPVASLLPRFELDDPRAREITVRQLLDQSSGMADSGFPELSEPQPRSLAEAVSRLADARLVADPGTVWNYHNPNYQVAARMVEVVSGMDFAAYLDERVFGPLGMEDTTTTVTDDEEVPGLADGHTLVYGRPVSADGPGYFVEGSGGVVSTATDLAEWLVMQNNLGLTSDGARVVSGDAVTEMHTPSADDGYALGWDTDGPADDPTEVSHGGTQYTFSADQRLLPESGYGIVLLFNSTSALGLEQTAIVDGVQEIVEGGTAPQGPPVSSGTVDLVLALVSLAAIGLGVLGVARARRWAARRTDARTWRLVLRMLPLAVVIGFAPALPDVAGFLFGGRDVTWLSAVYGWVALVVLVITAAIAAAATVTARLVHLARRTNTPIG